jgi:pyrroline-5-carboxylate reductase
MSEAFEPPASSRTLGSIAGKILLVGAGKMGTAMLQGWMALGLAPHKILVIEPQPSGEVTALAKQGVALNPAKAAEAIAAVVIAVKPQVAPETMARLLPFVANETVVVSIMAGRTLNFLESALPGRALVRAMPNTPAAIGRGITVAVPNQRVSAAQRECVHALLSAMGSVEWINDETLMDAVTALSGSGPAYVFLLAESMARAGAAAGLPAELSGTLARATVAGSGELLHRSQLPAATLRQNVTSPGGTTAAALEHLLAEDGLQSLMTRAIAAAVKRSRELAG